MATAVYALCALTSIACAVLLVRAWTRGREPLLLWSGVCFAGLAANNVLLLVDLSVITDIDLRWARSVTALIGVLALIYGLVWKSGARE